MYWQTPKPDPNPRTWNEFYILLTGNPKPQTVAQEQILINQARHCTTEVVR
jgi:hypothetical protein